ncbi:MAG: hypothetical protein ACYC5K_07750 [Saccharofermentanales bacterium]
MKKTLSLVFVAILVMSMLTVTAFASSFSGSIWTNTPNWLGFGYYCTAAKNTSGAGTSIDRAAAYCYDSANAVTSSASTIGSTTAIANNNDVVPYKGFGKYWQVGTSNYASAWFYDANGDWD